MRDYAKIYTQDNLDQVIAIARSKQHMDTIELYLEGSTWMSQHSNPGIKELMGTDKVPLPCTSP